MSSESKVNLLKEEVTQAVVDFLFDDANKGVIEDSRTFAKILCTKLKREVEHSIVVGCIMSLQGLGVVSNESLSSTVPVITNEGKDVLENGAPEFQLLQSLSDGEVESSVLEKQLGWTPKMFSIALGQGMKNKWFKVRKVALPVEDGDNNKGKGKPKPKFQQFISRSVEGEVEDIFKKHLSQLNEGSTLSTADVSILKRRKFVEMETSKYFRVTKGNQFIKEWKTLKLETDLTADLLHNDNWKSVSFKPYNFAAKGLPVSGGHLHPLMKVRAELRQIFLELGYEEMPTNNFVESSFWNFDALFQPQSHPARDAHDTFFVSHPEKTISIPQDYLERVRDMHVNGGSGSVGWRSEWKEEEARKNLLRTHTTAVSARMLYKLAQQKVFKPVKYFSIDRVYRNETLDATHLAEFHQVEGLIADYNITLANLMAVVKEFFNRMGIPSIRMHSCYNPYTEPSMEIFGYHPTLKKWVELGNSGMFRPEMLLPMGLPPDVRVIAWGLSLERPTMIKYKIDNIRNLLGHRVPISSIRESPMCVFQPIESKTETDKSEDNAIQDDS